MLEERLLPSPEIEPLNEPAPAELPLPVVPDWDEQLQRAQRMARLIDRHLEYEACSRCLLAAEQMTPIGLCPEQRVSLVADVWALTRALQAPA